MTARRHSYFAKHFPEQSRADKTLAGKSKRISNLGQVRKTKKKSPGGHRQDRGKRIAGGNIHGSATLGTNATDATSQTLPLYSEKGTIRIAQ